MLNKQVSAINKLLFCLQKNRICSSQRNILKEELRGTEVKGKSGDKQEPAKAPEREGTEAKNCKKSYG